MNASSFSCLVFVVDIHGIISVDSGRLLLGSDDGGVGGGR